MVKEVAPDLFYGTALEVQNLYFLHSVGFEIKRTAQCFRNLDGCIDLPILTIFALGIVSISCIFFHIIAKNQYFMKPTNENMSEISEEYLPKLEQIISKSH